MAHRDHFIQRLSIRLPVPICVPVYSLITLSWYCMQGKFHPHFIITLLPRVFIRKLKSGQIQDWAN